MKGIGVGKKNVKSKRSEHRADLLSMDRGSARVVAEALGYVVQGTQLYLADKETKVVCTVCVVPITTLNLGGFSKKQKADSSIPCNSVCCSLASCLADWSK